MTLQQLLGTLVTTQDKEGKDVQISPEFRVAVQQVVRDEGGGIHFIIHANGYNSETLDFLVVGNELTPI